MRYIMMTLAALLICAASPFASGETPDAVPPLASVSETAQTLDADSLFRFENAGLVQRITVGRNIITTGDIDDAVRHKLLWVDAQIRLARLAGQDERRIKDMVRQFEEMKKTARADAIRQLIIMNALRDNIEQTPWRASPEDVDRQYDEILRLFGSETGYETRNGRGSAKKLKQYLLDMETIADFHRGMYREVEQPNFAAIKHEYELNPADFIAPDRIRFRYIVIDSRNYESVFAARDKAQDIYFEIDEYLLDHRPAPEWKEPDTDFAKRLSAFNRDADALFAKRASEVTEDDARARSGLPTDSADEFCAYDDLAFLPGTFVDYVRASSLPVRSLAPENVDMRLQAPFEVSREAYSLFYIPWVQERRSGERLPLEAVGEEIERRLFTQRLNDKKRDWFVSKMKDIPVRIDGLTIAVDDLFP
ncbi:MAG: hypothetical protein ABIH86_05125 [Planctomycetota bacterium]